MGSFEYLGQLDRHATSLVQQEVLGLVNGNQTELMGIEHIPSWVAESNFAGMHIGCHHFFGCTYQDTRRYHNHGLRQLLLK